MFMRKFAMRIVISEGGFPPHTESLVTQEMAILWPAAILVAGTVSGFSLTWRRLLRALSLEYILYESGFHEGE